MQVENFLFLYPNPLWVFFFYFPWFSLILHPRQHEQFFVSTGVFFEVYGGGNDSSLAQPDLLLWVLCMPWHPTPPKARKFYFFDLNVIMFWLHFEEKTGCAFCYCPHLRFFFLNLFLSELTCSLPFFPALTLYRPAGFSPLGDTLGRWSTSQLIFIFKIFR